jgi:RNA polymerase subunit RPABC4/transcription elongation factor Spt4
MQCPNCQTELPESAKFCGVCGQSLSRDRPCPKCGQINPQGFKFCLQCGQPLTSTQPSSTPSSTPPPSPLPASFANGRYQVKNFPGEGGKKKVYLAHDSVLDLPRGADGPLLEWTGAIARMLAGAFCFGMGGDAYRRRTICIPSAASAVVGG